MKNKDFIHNDNINKRISLNQILLMVGLEEEFKKVLLF